MLIALGGDFMNFIKTFLCDAKSIIDKLDQKAIEKMINLIAKIKAERGRIFFLGVGGSAANASHAVNDFRKIVGIEAYAPTDNVSELTARINDEGWDHCFSRWLEGSHLNSKDAIFVFSVGGGNEEKAISVNLVRALQYAKKQQAKILGVVSRDGGYTAKVADACVIIPIINEATITPHAEAFQGVVWHLLVSHPSLSQYVTKWESVVTEKV